jgi:hypothetical protein
MIALSLFGIGQRNLVIASGRASFVPQYPELVAIAGFGASKYRRARGSRDEAARPEHLQDL